MESDPRETKEELNFESFNLSPAILDAIRELGYEKATPIQKEAIPLILEKQDLVALAQTGSGKTAACAIPVCHMVDPASRHVQTLIIVPTRELALQYATETQKIGRFRKVKAFALYGQEDMHMQRAKLKDGVQVLIATPGRLIDFIYARMIDLTHVQTLVLDEADQMLGMGFYEDLEFIIQCLIQSHQTLLFSATMPRQILDLAKHHMHEPKEIKLIAKQSAPESLHHHFYFCAQPKKRREELAALLKEIYPKQCLIFVNSRREVEELYRFLKNSFSDVDLLHGGLEQGMRTMITNKFAKGRIRALVATDVASRGLDFTQITHVFNYHFPFDNETYFHRSGRTARSGREGTCITLVTSRDLPQAQKLFRMLPKKPTWLKPPPSQDTLKR